jgi:1,4-dihydroxy-2-naphthoate octaprenyltransferase
VCAFLVCSVEVYSAAASILGLACQQDLVTVVVPALCIAVGYVYTGFILEPLDQRLKFLVFIVFSW